MQRGNKMESKKWEKIKIEPVNLANLNFRFTADKTLEVLHIATQV